MKHASALDTLVLLAERDTDQAAELLGKAIARRTDAQEKLAMLRQLRADYACRLQRHLHDGLSFAAFRNFQIFMEKIDRAIDGQQAIEASTVRQADDARQHWQSTQRDGRRWEMLVERAGHDQARQEARTERKQMDEFAARASQNPRAWS